MDRTPIILAGMLFAWGMGYWLGATVRKTKQDQDKTTVKMED